MMLSFQAALSACPLVAILRGVPPADCEEVGLALARCGFTLVEVPLNSPDPFESIGTLARILEGRAMVGAGTVLEAWQVDAVANAGGKLVVMPHADAAIVRRAKEFGLTALPGFATPTEAFAMLAAGADGLKLFPAEANPPPVLKAMRAVLPKQVAVLPVGSITPTNMAGYWAAGANGFGLGSALYRPGATAAEVETAAKAFKAEIDRLRSSAAR